MKNRKAVLRRSLSALAALCLCAVLLFGTAAPASAQNGSLTVKVDDSRLLKALSDGTRVIAALYKIAGRTGSDRDYEWSFVDEQGLTTPFAAFATRLVAYEDAIRNDRSPDTSLLADVEELIRSGVAKPVGMGNFSASGSVTFDNLPEGLYFFMMISGPSLLQMTSAVVPVPYVFRGSALYGGIETTAKVEWGTVPPPPSPVPSPYTPPNPVIPINPPANPPQPVQGETIIDDYDTPLGVAVEMNHMGDCYE